MKKYRYTIQINFLDGDVDTRRIETHLNPGEIIDYIRLLSEGHNIGTGVIESVSVGEDFEVFEVDENILTKRDGWIGDTNGLGG